METHTMNRGYEHPTKHRSQTNRTQRCAPARSRRPCSRRGIYEHLLAEATGALEAATVLASAIAAGTNASLGEIP